MSTAEKAELARLARRMLDGDLDLVGGCREIVRVHRRYGSSDDDALLTIVGIESETDELPVGDARENWSPAALAALDHQRDEFLRIVQPQLLEALQALAAEDVVPPES